MYISVLKNFIAADTATKERVNLEVVMDVADDDILVASKWTTGFWRQFKTLTYRNFLEAKGRILSKTVIIEVSYKIFWLIYIITKIPIIYLSPN